MDINPIYQLNYCSFRGCENCSDVLIERLIGGRITTYGYCKFHAIVAATFFSDKVHTLRIEIHV